jgi:glutathione synthase/RimK-type ligase-like ATP-grasp enzyme
MMIFKPRFGHSGAGVSLVSNLLEASTLTHGKPKEYLLQQYIPKPICLRIIASNNAVLSAYEKVLLDAIVVNVERGALRRPVGLNNSLANLAMETIKALGGGVMGVDILIRDQRQFVLEANAPFGFDGNDMNLKAKLIAQVTQKPY